MNIINQIRKDIFAFRMQYDRNPDRLIINYDSYSELRAEPGVLCYYQFHRGFDTFRGMKVIPTSVQIDGGFEVR